MEGTTPIAPTRVLPVTWRQPRSPTAALTPLVVELRPPPACYYSEWMDRRLRRLWRMLPKPEEPV